jgi:CDP-diacylglycerol pyrophosphatase
LPAYAVLHDRKGGAHFLLIPTRTISGIESPLAWGPGAVNYFEAAWQARDLLAGVAGRPVPPAAVGMAVNSIRARSQDQLHIHIECLGEEVYRALQAGAASLGTQWSSLSVNGWPYQALRVTGGVLPNPITRLAASLPPGSDLSQYTVLVAGMDFADGPGWAVLAAGAGPGAELLLDATCQVASAPPGT